MANKNDVEHSFLSTNFERRVVSRCTIIILAIGILLLASYISFIITIVGGCLIVVYISLLIGENPEKCFFIFFGTKMTFDAFWRFKIPLFENSELGLLEISFFPMLLFLALGPKITLRIAKNTITLAAVYSIWITIAVILNGRVDDLLVILRQLSLLFGLLVGFKYLRSRKKFDLLFFVLFISTLLPISFSLLQLLTGRVDENLFNCKLDYIRGIRYSGLYYDTATTGMISLISIASAGYLIILNRLRGWKKCIALIAIPLNLIIVISGGTRSMIFVAGIMVFLIFFRKVRTVILISPLLMGALIIANPYLEKAFERTSYEMRSGGITWSGLLEDKSSKQLFTGRVMIWQDIIDKYNYNDLIHQLFGSGESTNSHSSYFFLLIEIGILGLIYYIGLNMYLGLTLVRMPFSQYKGIKLLGLLSIILIMTIGFSASVVIYTSFQWVLYMIIAGTINIGQSTNNYNCSSELQSVFI